MDISLHCISVYIYTPSICIYIHTVLYVFTYVCLQMIIYTYSNTISALQPLWFCRGRRTTMYAKAKTKVLTVRSEVVVQSSLFVNLDAPCMDYPPGN